MHVSDDAIKVLVIESPQATFTFDPLLLEPSAYGRFALDRCADLARASALVGERVFDAVLVCAGAPEAEHLPLWPGWSQATLESAVVVWLAPPPDAELALRLLKAGAQDIVGVTSDGNEPDTIVARAVRFAVERKRVERAARKACATDLQTGLPNHQQLIEHMSQLLALRGREPAPMALLVMRIEGFATVEAAFGLELANVLRRKVAVRLRASVRASDVVAALAADTFALLLASTDEPLDAEHVARKLLAALHEPFQLSAQQVGVAASAGVCHYPADGVDADVLVRQAVAAAATAQAAGRGGFVNWRESVWHETGAANDSDIEPH
jgi:diguanylate cyclase (GGDEF)-like protein